MTLTAGADAPRILMELDDLFPHDLDELIERGLAPYRPVLSHLVLCELRGHLQTALACADHLTPCLNKLEDAARVRPDRALGLSPVQVALLGGTTPRRTIEDIAKHLCLRLDGGSRESDLKMFRLLISSYGCLDALAETYVVPLELDADACAREIYALIELGVVAMVAAMLGAAFVEHEEEEEAGRIETATQLQRHVMWAVLAFRQVDLSHEDMRTFDIYYMRQLDVRFVADRRNHAVEVEIVRRRAMLERLGDKLKREIARLGREVAPDPARTEPRSSPWLMTLLARETFGERRKEKGS